MRTFYPRKTILIPASEPHPEGTNYKISLGDEDWGDGTFQSVVKVQMVYDGKVAGRMSPSYPFGNDDLQRVSVAIEELTNGHSFSSCTYMIPVVLTKSGILDDLEEIINLTEEKQSSEKIEYTDKHTNFISYRMIDVFEHMFYDLSDHVKLFCDFNKTEGLATCDAVMKRLQKLESDDECLLQDLIESVQNIKNNVTEQK